MSLEPTPTHDPAVDAAGRTKLGLQRRALLRAGAGASPVLLSLASGSVSATSQFPGECRVASSFVSVATFRSRNPGVTNLQCASQNADFWRNQALQTTPPPGISTELAKTVAALMGSTASSFNGMTVKDVMLAPLPTTGTVQTTGELGTLQHLLAMVLNLNASFAAATGTFNVGYLQGVWANYKGNGNRYKLPSSNIDWGDAEIIAWLRVMMYPMP